MLTSCMTIEGKADRDSAPTDKTQSALRVETSCDVNLVCICVYKRGDYLYIK